MTHVGPHSFPRMALIVDDVHVIRELLKHILSSLNYTTVEAVDGEDAIDCLNKHTFDAVFLDWEMPGPAKGDEVARHLRAHPGNAHSLLIATTGDTSDVMRKRCAAFGADAFLGKALDTLSIVNALATATVARAARSSGSDPKTANTDPLATLAAHFPGGMAEARRHCRKEFTLERHRLRTAIADAQWSNAARAAHNIGALAAIVGVTDLSAAAKAVETALRQANTSTLPRVSAELDALVDRLCEDLSRADQSVTDPTG